MFFTNLKRIVRSGFVNFWRNKIVSFATVLIMTVTLFAIGIMIFIGALLGNTLEQLRDKVDVNIYFTTDAPEEEILDLQASLRALPEVENAEYTSRTEALAQFKERHKDDFLTIQAIEELEENPLGATLSVKAKETSQYETIARFLEEKPALSEGESAIIDKVNYYQNKVAIDRLTQIIDGASTIGFASIVLLILISIIITVNTIRLAIYTAREEIAVMRLVGAENRYIRGPFVVEGVMYGIFSAALALALLYPVSLWLGSETAAFFGGINLLNYYAGNFGQLLLIIGGSGVVLGAVASFVAARRYLKV